MQRSRLRTICSSTPRDDANTAGTEIQGLRLAVDLKGALARVLVSCEDRAVHIPVIVRTNDLPIRLVFGAVPGFQFHAAILSGITALILRGAKLGLLVRAAVAAICASTTGNSAWNLAR